jgi:serine protease Do
VARNFEALKSVLARERSTINFKVFKKDWFVISFSMPDGTDGYMHYHQDGSFVTGFTLYWKNTNGNIGGERIAVLMSGSLWSSMTGAPFPEPPARKMWVAAKPDTSSPTARPPSLPEPPAAEQPNQASFSTGTGFFISRDGAFVTAAHVIEVLNYRGEDARRHNGWCTHCC